MKQLRPGILSLLLLMLAGLLFASLAFGQEVRVSYKIRGFSADQKQMLVEAWLTHFPGRPIIVASGLAGFGGNDKLGQRSLGSLYICGDEMSECDACSAPMAPRVAVVAAMQANLAVELLV